MSNEFTSIAFRPLLDRLEALPFDSLHTESQSFITSTVQYSREIVTPNFDYLQMGFTIPPPNAPSIDLYRKVVTDDGDKIDN